MSMLPCFFFFFLSFSSYRFCLSLPGNDLAPHGEVVDVYN